MNKFNDFTIRPNGQSHRAQTDLWDVVLGGSRHVTTACSEAEAQAVADRLNEDPWALNRGQTRADRRLGAPPSK